MKSKTDISDRLKRLSSQVSLGVMALATVIGSFELNNHSNNRFVLPAQTVKVAANTDNELNNPLRRESEESTQNIVSYSQAQRTPSRSGKY